MTVSTKNAVSPTVFTIPNQLTVLRLALSIALFVLIALKMYLASLIVFLVAASTDWIDGYLARRYGLVTTLGRILDPFADKIIICGSFIFLVAIPELQSYLQAWMVVVIVGRELLVTALRSFLEERGRDFSAVMSGKLKMLLQCVAVAACLTFLAYSRTPPQAISAWISAANWTTAIEWIMVGSIWSAVLLTIYSGVAYVRAAVNLMA